MEVIAGEVAAGVVLGAIPKRVDASAGAGTVSTNNQDSEATSHDTGYKAITHHYRISRTETVDIIDEDISKEDETAETKKKKEKRKKSFFSCCCFGKVGN